MLVRTGVESKVDANGHRREDGMHGCSVVSKLPCPWESPGKNTGVVCHFLLQGIFLTQGSNPSLLHWWADSLPLSHPGSPGKMAGLCKKNHPSETVSLSRAELLVLNTNGSVNISCSETPFPPVFKPLAHTGALGTAAGPGQVL